MGGSLYVGLAAQKPPPQSAISAYKKRPAPLEFGNGALRVLLLGCALAQHVDVIVRHALQNDEPTHRQVGGVVLCPIR